MSKRKRSEWLRCPACREVKEDFTATAGAGNAYSRYADIYICSGCGLGEAVKGFFWRPWCNPQLIKEHHRSKT